jgi:hypothetical protein
MFVNSHFNVDAIFYHVPNSFTLQGVAHLGGNFRQEKGQKALQTMSLKGKNKYIGTHEIVSQN